MQKELRKLQKEFYKTLGALLFLELNLMMVAIEGVSRS